MSRIFISYRRTDSEGYVGRLYDHLLKHFKPDDIFMDVDNIRPGEDFVQVLEDAVAQCDVLLAVIGPHWLMVEDESGNRRLDQWNDFVRIEIASALERGILVIPVLVGGTPMPIPDALPDNLQPLSRRNAASLGHRSFAYDVEQLANVIQESVDIGRKAKPKVHNPTVVSEKTVDLKQVRDEVVNLSASPLYEYRKAQGYFPVLGDGNPDANIMFIGESPGKSEAEQGQPFVGPSGDVLNELLTDIGLTRADIYLTNIVKDRAPKNRDPKPEEIEIYAPFLDREIHIIKPQVIATLGRYAMTYILKKFDCNEKTGTISALHGKLIEAKAPYGDIFIVPLYHPAVVLYTASKKGTLKQDFDKLRFFI